RRQRTTSDLASTPPSSLTPPSFFLFTDPPPTTTYTLSLHDALPISHTLSLTEIGLTLGLLLAAPSALMYGQLAGTFIALVVNRRDRKSTRLNSSHRTISYAVFCLKKKKQSQ